ncbi:hypothetical protein N8T08_008707 [Aspergillus melleus]|uniref:Uncharacterized protein n=1 Tax=Aspergillus melleus TaxID=138277 RepID=A0ACC3BEP5_9EURO|nr:hypothetical protein N8T08_008707 [Aspergillus melleus]
MGSVLGRAVQSSAAVIRVTYAVRWCGTQQVIGSSFRSAYPGDFSGRDPSLEDLHLEINQQYSSFKIPARAKYLILAGDVGRFPDYHAFRDFIRQLTTRFELVFLVLENHEFYNGTFAAGLGLKKAKQLERDPLLDGRLVILHRKRYDIPGTRVSILGCTVWSAVPHHLRGIVQAKVKDFKRIEGWTVDDHNAHHKFDILSPLSAGVDA